MFSTGTQFVYDAENHQTEVKDGQSNTVGEYLYDGEGRRVKKITAAETTVFVYNAGGQLVAEYSTQTAQEPRVSYLTTDHLGSPRVVTDENGAVVDRKDYTAFGEENYTPERLAGLGYSAADEVRKGYTGYEKDSESGLDFAQARYYKATHGRFTSVDPLTASASIRNPQTFNRYSYVLNSPYKFTDPLGLLPVGWSDSYGFCGADNSSCSNTPNEWNYVEIAPAPEQEETDEGVVEATAHEAAHASQQEAEGPESPPPPMGYGYDETTRTLQTTMVDGSNSVDITVTITTRTYFQTDGNGGEVVQAGVPPRTEGPLVDVSLSNANGYTSDQQNIIKSVTTAIVSAASGMNVDARVAIALGIKESKLGTGAQIVGNKAAWKDPVVNPLQLSAACKKCPPRAKAGIANQGYNIKGALQVYKDLGGSIKAFGGEGVAPSQKGYSAGVQRYYGAISDKTRYKTVCLSGSCR